MILHKKIKFKAPIWNKISAEAKDLISACLTLNPKKRISAAEAIDHPFITQKL
jgi:serine/threonine protein kinase